MCGKLRFGAHGLAEVLDWKAQRLESWGLKGAKEQSSPCSRSSQLPPVHLDSARGSSETAPAAIYTDLYFFSAKVLHVS